MYIYIHLIHPFHVIISYLQCTWCNDGCHIIHMFYLYISLMIHLYHDTMMVTVSCVKTDTMIYWLWRNSMYPSIIFVSYIYIYIYMAFVFESFWRWFVTPCPIYLYIYIYIYISFPHHLLGFPNFDSFSLLWLLGLGRLWKSPRTVITWDVFFLKIWGFP